MHGAETTSPPRVSDVGSGRARRLHGGFVVGSVRRHYPPGGNDPPTLPTTKIPWGKRPRKRRTPKSPWGERPSDASNNENPLGGNVLGSVGLQNPPGGNDPPTLPTTKIPWGKRPRKRRTKNPPGGNDPPTLPTTKIPWGIFFSDASDNKIPLGTTRVRRSPRMHCTYTAHLRRLTGRRPDPAGLAEPPWRDELAGAACPRLSPSRTPCGPADCGTPDASLP